LAIGFVSAAMEYFLFLTFALTRKIDINCRCVHDAALEALRAQWASEVVPFSISDRPTEKTLSTWWEGD
jgi:hypothetical protein